MKLHLSTQSSRKRGQQAGLAARQAAAAELGKETIRNGEMLWHISPLERMSARQFEQWLVGKFGPEYLAPVPYCRQPDGTLVPREASA